ncbi:MAG: hypothetical protein EOP19_07090 [Hyphomicrobiales bacterium]|nr:MAG: hypothetical protein EOP19_07090 [Hyphomicrobiales bacterium]
MRTALGELLSWSELLRSPQLAKFLNHIVDAKLSGQEAGIKAYSIAVDVFGRPPSFDPQTDPIVRVQARRLRGLLQEFYRQDLSRSPVRITLPVGRYVPEFEFVAPEPEEVPVAGPPEVGGPTESAGVGELPARSSRRRFWIQATAAASLVLLVGLLLVGLQIFREPPSPGPSTELPQEPTVYISAFTNLGELPGLDGFGSRLNDQLSSILAQFEDVQVGFVEPGRPLGRTAGSFLLSGTIASGGGGIEVTAVLTETGTGSTVWNRTMRQPLPPAGDDAIAAATARQIMRELGPFRSPVHAPGRRWLDANSLQLPAVSGYVCLLTFRYARETANPASIAKALDCHDRLLAQQPDLPLALAAEAWLEGRVIYNAAMPADRMDLALARPAELAERAVRLAPESSFAHEQLASIQNWQESYRTAQRNYAIALGFEPLNTDARASYAITLARLGDLDEAGRQAQMAIADTPTPAPWYYFLPSLIALRDGRIEQAIADGRTAAQGGEVGAIVALAAAGLAGDAAAVADFLPRVMSMESLRRAGVLPWLGIRIKDVQMLELLADGLRAGGIPESALTAPF